MAKPVISTKRVAISKANAQMVGIVGAAVFIAVFSLIASQSLFKTNKYRSHVVAQKQIAKNQLIANTNAYNSLKSSYLKLDQADPNALDGSREGTGANDGNNARIVLDALPSSYDFPAVTSTIEKILKDRNLSITGITGTDDQTAQQTNVSSTDPKPVPMPFSFGIDDANYGAVEDLISTLGNSIRPIQIDKLTLSGGSTDMTLSLDAHTYYQPGKSLTITKKVVK